MDVLPWWQVPVGWWVCPSLALGIWYRLDGWATSTRVIVSDQWADISPFELVVCASPDVAALAVAFNAEIIEVTQ